MRKLTANLSYESLMKLADDIDAYKGTLIAKNELFIQRLSEVGIPVIKANIAASRGDSDKSSDTFITVTSSDNQATAILTVKNEDILFIEFGAGIRYNQGGKHPKADEFGYGVGTYPGQQYAYDEDGWYYYDEGIMNLRHSYGTEATMPVHNASIEIINHIDTIAREVFGNG